MLVLRLPPVFPMTAYLIRLLIISRPLKSARLSDFMTKCEITLPVTLGVKKINNK